jgi:hypothetical protein
VVQLAAMRMARFKVSEGREGMYEQTTYLN